MKIRSSIHAFIVQATKTLCNLSDKIITGNENDFITDVLALRSPSATANAIFDRQKRACIVLA